MIVTLALLLCSPLYSLWTAFPFRDMLKSTQLVVLASVDSIWSVMDTVLADKNHSYSYEKIVEQRHVSAKILALYVKSDSIIIPDESVHLVYRGAIYYPDETVMLTSTIPSHTLGETFLSPLFESSWLHSDTEPIYRGTMTWKYSVSNDSIFLYVEDAYLSLVEVLDSLSKYFIRVDVE